MNESLTQSLTQEVEEVLRQIAPRLAPGADLIQSGVLDSLNLVKLMVAIEAHFGVDIALDEVDLDAFRSPARIAALIERSMADSSQPVAVTGSTSAGSVIDLQARQQVIADLQEIFAAELAVRINDPDENLFQSGILDSVTLVQLILQMESTFQLVLPMQTLDLASFESITSIADLICAAKAARR